MNQTNGRFGYSESEVLKVKRLKLKETSIFMATIFLQMFSLQKRPLRFG